ncbi:MAG: hypothetical protein FWF97_01755 [Alphaproteobacteria bacterium]|nr:hypothetical protein [Alphaproteobacteria bacterium]
MLLCLSGLLKTDLKILSTGFQQKTSTFSRRLRILLKSGKSNKQVKKQGFFAVFNKMGRFHFVLVENEEILLES